MPRTRRLVFVAFALIPCMSWAQGDPIGPEFRVNTYTTGLQIRPSVARSASGDFVVVWGSDQGSNVYGQRYDAAGSPAGAEFAVSEVPVGLSNVGADVASDPSGNFVVVWHGPENSWDIKARRFSSSGAPLSSEFRVNTSTTGGQLWPSVTMDGAGNAIVTWTSFEGIFGDIFGQRFASSGAPVGPEFRVNTYTSFDQRYPFVASNAAGDFVVVWQSYDQDGSGYGVFGQRYASSGAPAGPEFRVNSITTDDETLPSVASDASGGFVVVWFAPVYPLPSGRVFGQRYAGSGAPLGTQFQVGPETELRYPTVAADTGGNFVVSWMQFDDFTFYGIWAQRYSSAGAPLGPEFRVNTYTTASQRRPSVAVDASSNFVVIWDSAGNGDPDGIFGQRFSMIVPVEVMHFRVE
jgi:hypothetical protein